MGSRDRSRAETGGGRARAGAPLRAAYADPPYPGQAKRHYAEHPDYAGEVDHPALIERLTADYEAWALSTSSPALRDLLPRCPETVRVAAWVKPWASWKPGVRVAYAWEPVLYVTPRRGQGRGNRAVDWTAASAAMCAADGDVNGTKGWKPRDVCAWLFDLLGLERGDELDDLFPGSGSVGASWRWWQAQPTLPQPERPRDLRERQQSLTW